MQVAQVRSLAVALVNRIFSPVPSDALVKYPQRLRAHPCTGKLTMKTKWRLEDESQLGGGICSSDTLIWLCCISPLLLQPGATALVIRFFHLLQY